MNEHYRKRLLEVLDTDEAKSVEELTNEISDVNKRWHYTKA